MLLLLSVQVGGGGDQTSVRVDAEEFVAGTRKQTVPHHSVLLWKVAVVEGGGGRAAESRQYTDEKKS